VKDLFDHESKTDQVFYCGKPGIPRIGPPRKIVQTPGEVILFYEDISGDPYRIIPTDGRPHRVDADPTYYGDSVARWDGETLVVDVAPRIVKPATEPLEESPRCVEADRESFCEQRPSRPTPELAGVSLTSCK
jgi:hypothetical protein